MQPEGFWNSGHSGNTFEKEKSMRYQCAVKKEDQREKPCEDMAKDQEGPLGKNCLINVQAVCYEIYDVKFLYHLLNKILSLCYYMSKGHLRIKEIC